jgi:hypothetical protein
LRSAIFFSVVGPPSGALVWRSIWGPIFGFFGRDLLGARRPLHGRRSFLFDLSHSALVDGRIG